MTEVAITESAESDLAGLESEVRDRILSKLDQATEWPEHFLKPLSNTDLYALRAGDYRGLCDWDRENDVLVLHAAGHRRNVYDRKL